MPSYPEGRRAPSLGCCHMKNVGRQPPSQRRFSRVNRASVNSTERERERVIFREHTTEKPYSSRWKLESGVWGPSINSWPLVEGRGEVRKT